jgi:hypothetical protein
MHAHTQEALKQFIQQCKKSRAHMQFTLPDMLKQRPKQFWGLLKGKTTTHADLPLQAFTEFNKEFFYDASIPPDSYTPLSQAATQHISPAELTAVLAHNFKANKSSGLSCVPLQLLKHLGPQGIKCMA